jgi:hypothetical protein
VNEYRSPQEAGYEAWVDAELARIQAEHNADEIGKMAHVVAGLVIARTEHARAIRKTMADTDRHETELASLRHMIGEVRREITELTQVVDDLVETVITQNAEQGLVSYSHVKTRVDGVDVRLDLIERALPEIERRLKLRRRDGAWAPQLDEES